MMRNINIQLQSIQQPAKHNRRSFNRLESGAIIHIRSIDDDTHFTYTGKCRDISQGGFSIHINENNLNLKIGQRVCANIVGMNKTQGTMGYGTIVWINEKNEYNQAWAGVMLDKKIDNDLFIQISNKEPT